MLLHRHSYLANMPLTHCLSATGTLNIFNKICCNNCYWTLKYHFTVVGRKLLFVDQLIKCIYCLYVMPFNCLSKYNVSFIYLFVCLLLFVWFLINQCNKVNVPLKKKKRKSVLNYILANPWAVSLICRYIIGVIPV